MRPFTPALALLVLLAVGSVAPAWAAAPPRTVRLISGGASSSATATAGPISADGSRATFRTPESLVAADVNANIGVYARDVDGTLQLVSAGTAAADANPNAISATGGRVVYTTNGADLPTDTDAQQ